MHIPFLTDDPSDTSFPYFWGPIDSLHTFCERKYITHPMAAEVRRPGTVLHTTARAR